MLGKGWGQPIWYNYTIYFRDSWLFGSLCFPRKSSIYLHPFACKYEINQRTGPTKLFCPMIMATLVKVSQWIIRFLDHLISIRASFTSVPNQSVNVATIADGLSLLQFPIHYCSRKFRKPPGSWCLRGLHFWMHVTSRMTDQRPSNGATKGEDILRFWDPRYSVLGRNFHLIWLCFP